MANPNNTTNNATSLKEIHVNITDSNKSQVVDKLDSIVNGAYCSTYRFEIKNEKGESQLFRLKPKPSPNQPGNGLVSYVDRVTKREITRSYDNLNSSLKEAYKEDTKRFAQDIKNVFENNLKIFDVPQATASAYMLLLFEIGRRLVKDSRSDLDKLPIAIAIEKIGKLLEAEKCSFGDVFSKQGTFHCFTGSLEERRKAIDNIDCEHERLMPCEDEAVGQIDSKLKKLSL